MGEQHVERRMAAILAADVAGYGRLTEADEEGTHARLKAHRRELIDPKIKEHHGRIVQSAGDGALVEFPSVVEAVRCAIDVQHGMAERNAKTPRRERIEFRIGINLGDIILEEEDIYGNGVNIAVRLENLARPGSIYISGAAFDQVGNGISRRCKFLGAQRVKNIAKPVRVYRIRLEPSGTATALWRQWRTELVGGAALLIVIGVAGAAYVPYHSSLNEPAIIPPGPTSEAQGATAAAEVPKETPPLDAQVWQAIRDSTDREAFEAFLRIFPNGAVADLARERLRALAPEHYPSASTTRPTSAAPAPAPQRQRIASRSDPPPDPAPQPQAIATSPVPVALPAPKSPDRSDGTTSTTPTRAPQQQAAIPPSSSNPVTNPALPRARFDGKWHGRTIGQTGCNSAIRVTVANSTVSGQITFGTYGGNTEVSGTVSDDGSFAGRVADATLSGKFEEDRFEGVFRKPAASPALPVTGMGSSGQYCTGMLVILERAK